MIMSMGILIHHHLGIPLQGEKWMPIKLASKLLTLYFSSDNEERQPYERKRPAQPRPPHFTDSTSSDASSPQPSTSRATAQRAQHSVRNKSSQVKGLSL